MGMFSGWWTVGDKQGNVREDYKTQKSNSVRHITVCVLQIGKGVFPLLAYNQKYCLFDFVKNISLL